MHILEEIIVRKKEEISEQRKQVSIEDLIRLPAFKKKVVSLADNVKKGNGIITEFKRESPSAGKFHNRSLEEVVKSYSNQNVSGYSILTDEKSFSGKIEDLQTASDLVDGPILRKEFIIDEYQIFEAKAYGADAILLIAEALDEYHTTYLTTIAQSLGLEVLMELHSQEELEKLNDSIDLIGINNRNLRTLKTDVKNSEDLIKYLPYDAVKITESGVNSPVDIEFLYGLGFDGCLIGESILRDPKLLQNLSQAAERSKTIAYES